MQQSEVPIGLLREPIFIPLPPMPLRMSTQLAYGLLVIFAMIVLVSFLVRMPIGVVVFIAVMFALTISFAAIMAPLRERKSVREYRRWQGQPADVQMIDTGSMREYRTVPAEPPAPVTESEEEISKLLTDMAEDRRVFGGRDQGFWTWAKLESERIRRELPRPSTVAASTLRNELQAIPRIEAMLEPEFIVASPPQRFKASLFMPAFFLFVAMTQVMERRWTGAAFFGIAALVGCASIPAVRNRISGLRPENRAPVAGVGTIEDHKGRRWCVGEATMLIWSHAAKLPLFVFVVGPAGWTTFTFASSADPDFINLWQRWTHPNPRPELRA